MGAYLFFSVAIAAYIVMFAMAFVYFEVSLTTVMVVLALVFMVMSEIDSLSRRDRK